MFDHKIVFIGPTGCGKTTAIHTYSDIEPVMTDVKASEVGVGRMKENTTVALDYGSVTLDGETKVHLYGTPGQERFDFMWDILGKGSHGIVLLVDHTAHDPIGRLYFYFEKFRDFLENVPCVVGINKFDSPAPHDLTYEDYCREVEAMYPGIEVYEVDVRKEEDVRMLIMTLLFSTSLPSEEGEDFEFDYTEDETDEEQEATDEAVAENTMLADDGNNETSEVKTASENFAESNSANVADNSKQEYNNNNGGGSSSLFSGITSLFGRKTTTPPAETIEKSNDKPATEEANTPPVEEVDEKEDAVRAYLQRTAKVESDDFSDFNLFHSVDSK